MKINSIIKQNFHTINVNDPIDKALDLMDKFRYQWYASSR